MVQKRVEKKSAVRRAPVDPVRAFSVRVPSSLLARVKGKADMLGLKLQGVSRQALELWAGGDVQRELLQPFGAMTAEERRHLTAVLEVLRGSDTDMQAILRAVVKRHTRESGKQTVGAGA